MNLSQRPKLLAIGLAAALASGLALFVLGSFGHLRVDAAVERRQAELTSPATVELAGPIFTPAPLAPHSRFAFVRLEAFPLLLPPVEPASYEPPPAGLPDSWTAETRMEPPGAASGPRLSALPPPRLPWQTPPLSAPQRTYTLAERLGEIAPPATKRLADKFEAAKAVWPPAEISLVAIKDEKTIELYARPSGGEWKFIHRYRVLAASGGAGPKLRQGDKQVPEGVYGISFLNPNSRYHVSLRVNYPNAFDLQMAAMDGRKDLGGDIMIHGKALSVGCLAIGDEAAEEVFVLAAQIGLPKIRLIIAPTDFRSKAVPAPEPGQTAWLPKLYAEVAGAMSEFKAPPRSTGLLSFFAN